MKGKVKMDKIKTLMIDIETYSSIDLSKCGVYKYTESEDFEILLISYSVNLGEVITIDLACGEIIPNYIVEAIKSDDVIKYAYNSQFERVSLSKYLGIKKGSYLNPGSWECDMISAAYLGLPQSLKGVGEVLKLDKKKMEEGKELIKYFCVPCNPTETNGGRTRNLPSDAPDKWAMFKNYNKRDVETEMEIHCRISKYPVPDFVWDEYHIDQEINDRGVLVDFDLVDNAISIDVSSKNDLFITMQNITNLDNPNSVAQMKEWLKDNGITTNDLGKKNVIKLKDELAGSDIGNVLSLRLQLSKSSIKKYQAMKNAASYDKRVRGMFRFYGANRTGRFCLTGDHEIFTKNGWLRLDEWQGGEIACWSPHGEQISFQKAQQVSFDYEGDMYSINDTRISQVSTPDHKMYIKRRYDLNWEVSTVEKMFLCRPSIPTYGYRENIYSMENEKLRVLVMVQADGHYNENDDLLLGFVKERKINRCKKLLRNAGLPFVVKVYDNVGNKKKTTFKIPSRCVPLWLKLFSNKTFGSWLLNCNAEIFFEELVYWDGCRMTENSIQYCTCNKTNADIIQGFAHLSGRATTLITKVRSDKHPNWSDAYYLNIWSKAKNSHEIKNKPIISNYKGKVYCASTATGYFLVRRNGRVWITGNSSKTIQLQNLPQNHLPDLKEARELVKTGNAEALSMLYENIPDTLSQLIRTAFVPREGCKFIVADFSAIEARVIAWFAREKWRLDTFERGDDIYCASASQMFHVPVVKHGVNGELRQKGKIAELALGYGGSVGALTAMGALDMGLKEEELKPLVDAWRTSNPRIVAFWWEIDKLIKNVVKGRTRGSVGQIIASYESGFLFITLPSGRRLAYVKPRMGENQFGGEAVTYEGIGATKKWERLESYGPKFVENIVQATARDILCNSMKNLRAYRIVAHVHDELIIECPMDTSLDFICKEMAKSPEWCKDLNLRADGYECMFYQKD